MKTRYFEYHMPTKIVFGRGKLALLGQICKNIGNKAILVTGKSAMRDTGILQVVIDSLKSEGVVVSLSDNIPANPDSDTVDAAVEIARQANANVVIGIGGGSVIDAAKAVAVTATTRDSVCNLIGKTLLPSDLALPIIAIPTTAGTGSEVTKGAIIKDSRRNLKSGIRGSDIFPKVALIDPLLCLSMPRTVIIETAFDALTHAIETYVARRATPLSEIISEKSLQLLSVTLPQIEKSQYTEEISETMSLVALYGGINIGNCGSCLPHRLQQATGSLCHIEISHARGLSSLYPSWLEHAVDSSTKKFDQVAKLLNMNNISEFPNLLSNLELPSSLGEIGIEKSDVSTILNNVTGSIENDPIDNVDEAILKSILLNAL
jgi:alcohol dehydrogenase class IV